MVCQFYLSFQRTSFWLCWFLLWSLLFLLHLILPYFFKISFLLLTLGFFISSFSSCFQCKVRLFTDFSLVSWGKLVLLWTFPLVLLLLNSVRFGLLCFHFHLFPYIFWFLLWFLGYSEAYCLGSICLYFNCFFL